jgi:hypothetical protein
VLDQHILPPFPKDYAKQYIALEQGLLEFMIEEMKRKLEEMEGF